MIISLLELIKKNGEKSSYCKTCLSKTVSRGNIARSMVIFASRLERFVLWLSRADNLWEMFWTREKSSSFDFSTDSNLLFILASAIFLSLSADTTTSLWFPEIITFPSEAVVLTRADQAIWRNSHETQIKPYEIRIEHVDE